VPATLFVNARWIEANPRQFRQLAADPLFEIANHGTEHRPLDDRYTALRARPASAK
jgi:peptidoglycan/xylan/chitin deacetylase (PgdA/CDA1 family)